MPNLWVTCVTRLPGRNAHEAITHVGGAGWRWPREQVIGLIRDGSHDFYLLAGGNLCRVDVVEGGKRPYLRARSEGQWDDSLLSLPECR